MLAFALASMWEKGSAAIPANQRSAGVATEVNLRNILRTGFEGLKRRYTP